MNFPKLQILFLVLYVLFTNIIAQTDINIVKAAYIDKIILFTQFPPRENDKQINIGVIGDKLLFNTLSNFYSKNKNSKKNIDIKLIANMSELKNYQIIYISDTEKNRIK